MKVTARSFETQRAARARVSAAALCCVLAIAPALAGCAATKAAGNTVPPAISISTGSDDSREAFSLRIPDDWNGQVAMLLRGAVPQQSVAPTSSSDRSASERAAASVLLDCRVAVATPSGQAGETAGISGTDERLYIHFALGFGSPTSVYLVGMSQGEYVALATIEKAGGVFDRAMVYSPGGFVHVSSPVLRDSRTIELALQADEPVAALLSNRLGIDRRDLARSLEFYFRLLTGVRNEPEIAVNAVGAGSVR